MTSFDSNADPAATDTGTRTATEGDDEKATAA
jgi:hypothetical protein